MTTGWSAGFRERLSGMPPGPGGMCAARAGELAPVQDGLYPHTVILASPSQSDLRALHVTQLHPNTVETPWKIALALCCLGFESDPP